MNKVSLTKEAHVYKKGEKLLFYTSTPTPLHCFFILIGWEAEEREATEENEEEHERSAE